MADYLAPVLLPLMSAVISGAFAVSVGLQFLKRKRPHQLSWSLGLGLFATASVLEASSEAWGWSEVAYRAYYPSTALLVGCLGLGTIYLMGRRWGRWYLYALVPLAVALVGLAAVVPVAPPQDAGIRAGAGGFPTGVRYVGDAIVIPGSLALIAGALLSWWRTRRSYNLLIAVGALVIAIGGSLERLGSVAAWEMTTQVSVLYITNLVGIAVMFAGFLRSQEVSARAAVAKPTTG